MMRFPFLATALSLPLPHSHTHSFTRSLTHLSTNKGKKRVAVIGAGAAGLTAIKNILEQYSSQLDVKGFEQSERVGGVWASSTMWDSLTTNLPANAVMQFRDHKYPSTAPSYVHHSIVKDYLKSYSEKYSIQQYYEFNSTVVSVRPREPGKYESSWEVDVCTSDSNGDSNGDKSCEDNIRTEYFDAVIVSSGHFDKPYVPPIEGLPSSISLLPDTVTHSKAYLNPSEFEGKSVLVIGCGASGVEICPELAAVAKDVRVVAPKRQPKDEFFEIPHDVRESHPNLELIEGLVQSIELGDGKSALTKHRAVLHSGRVLDGIDRILFCTGYHYEYSFLDDECGISVTSGKAVTPLVHQLWNSKYPTMCFPSLLWKALTFPLVELQIQAFLKILQTTNCFSSPQQIPEQWQASAVMARAMEERKELEELEKLPIYAHMLGFEHSDYVRTLLAIQYGAGIVPSEWQLLLDIYQEAGPARVEHGSKYRQRDYVLADDSTSFKVLHKF